MAYATSGLAVKPNGANPYYVQGNLYNQFGVSLRTFVGHWSTPAFLPNAASNLATGQSYFFLRAGDTAWVDSTATLYLCKNKGTSGAGDALWVPITPISVQVTGTAETVTSLMHGSTRVCTNAAGCTATFANNLAVGTIVRYTRGAAGNVTLAPGTGTFRVESGVPIATTALWQVIQAQVLYDSSIQITRG